MISLLLADGTSRDGHDKLRVTGCGSPKEIAWTAPAVVSCVQGAVGRLNSYLNCSQVRTLHRAMLKIGKVDTCKYDAREKKSYHRESDESKCDKEGNQDS